MSDQLCIIEGDHVTVDLIGGDTISGIVHRVPSATGDAWIIETEETLVYVQTYQAIWRRKVQP